MTTLGFYFAGLSNEEANAVRQQLNEIAAGLGYVAQAGPTAGQGNAAALLIAIARGEATVSAPRKQNLFDAAAFVATEIQAGAPKELALRQEAARIHAFLADKGPTVQNKNLGLWMHALCGVLRDKHAVAVSIPQIREIVRDTAGPRGQRILEEYTER